MRSESEIENRYKVVAQVADNLDDDSPFEAIAPIIVTRTLRWVLEEESEDEGNLMEEIDEYLEELEEDEGN